MMSQRSEPASRKRPRSPSSDPPWRRTDFKTRHSYKGTWQDAKEGVVNAAGERRIDSGKGNWGKPQPHAGQNISRNIAGDDELRRWVDSGDAFELEQAKRRSAIRVKDGRGKAVDFLTVTLEALDPERAKRIEDNANVDEELDIFNPEGVFEGLTEAQLLELKEEIKWFMTFETKRSDREFWATMTVICLDRLSRLNAEAGPGTYRAVRAVRDEVQRILSGKTLEELSKLETSILKKLDADQQIDVDYWDYLLRNLRVHKAQVHVRNLWNRVLKSRKERSTAKVSNEAVQIRAKVCHVAKSVNKSVIAPWRRDMDPESMLKIRLNDKALDVLDEQSFLFKLVIERRKLVTLGHVARSNRTMDLSLSSQLPPIIQPSASTAPNTIVMPGDALGVAAGLRFAATPQDDHSSTTLALYEREAARGVGENEEIFQTEESLPDAAVRPPWADKHRPRKPRYFNRVQMGYEWNKYNQTHYDHDNPPPKVVQGYKFNIFYPDLIDKSKTPTYRIVREHGRKRGQSFAKPGEEDTCLIKFIAGAPYEDIAFRIVDKEWDYSAKRERGFKSSFDKGILQLHFQLKKIYYRK